MVSYGTVVFSSDDSDSDSLEDEVEFDVQEENPVETGEPEDDGEEGGLREEANEESSVAQTDGNDGAEEPVCAICLEPLSGRDVGIPGPCNHHFCMGCIMEWSRHSNTCPLDRLEFCTILVVLGDRKYN